jgi:hypothetical protein
MTEVQWESLAIIGIFLEIILAAIFVKWMLDET